MHQIREVIFGAPAGVLKESPGLPGLLFGLPLASQGFTSGAVVSLWLPWPPFEIALGTLWPPWGSLWAPVASA